MKRIAIVGAGAMGSLFASHLATSPAEIWAFDNWREHIDAIRENGLAVLRGGAEQIARVRATSDAAEAGLCDAVMIFVKYGQTAAAIEAARPMITPQTLLITAQNGIGNVELIRERYPDCKVIFGLTTLTSELLGPGRIAASYDGIGETYLWPHDGAPSAELRQFCELLSKSGVNVALKPDIELEIWKKLVVNCCLNTMCAITGLKVGALIDTPDTWPFLDTLVEEIAAVANRKNIALAADDARAFLRRVADDARDHEPSMLIDVRNGRMTEIDCLNGAVLRESERLAMSTPNNRAIYSVVKILEQAAARRTSAPAVYPSKKPV